MGDGSPSLDRRLFPFQRSQLCGQVLVWSVAGSQPPGIDFVLLGIGPLFRSLCQDACETSDLGHRFDITLRKSTIVESQVLDSGTAQRFTGRSLSNAERYLCASRSAQLVAFDVHLLKLAVEVDLHSRSLPRTVVRQGHMSPLVPFDLGLSDSFQCIIRPFADQMHADTTALDPQVPTLIFRWLIHASDDRAVCIVGLNPNPRRTTERLFLFKVSCLWNVEGRPLDLQGLG